MQTNNQNPMPPTNFLQEESKKWYQHKGIITIGSLAVLVCIIVWIYFARQPTVKLSANTRITGTVVQNYQGCSYDDGCVLTIQTTAGKKISAIYGGGLTVNGACYLNSGFGLIVGDQVELYGTYTNQNIFSLCVPGSFIKKVSSPPSSFAIPPTSNSNDTCVQSSCWGHLGCNYYTCTKTDGSNYRKFVN